MLEYIEKMKPYFSGIRDIENQVSIDIIIPTNWKYQSNEVEFIVQDTNDVETLLSVISSNTNEGYNLVYTTVLSIIKYNLEEEEKERLYNEKMIELQTLFKNKSLDSLKELNFIVDGK